MCSSDLLVGSTASPYAQVNVTGGYNMRAIYTLQTSEGTIPNSGGTDSGGQAYEGSQLDPIISHSPIAWQLGVYDQNNQNNGWYNGASLTVTGDKASTSPRYLNLLGTGVNGSPTGNVTLTYSDGSTATWTQSFSDWVNSGVQTGEVIEGSMTERLYTSDGVNKIGRAHV